ncbi:MAG: diacylglycerol kinase family protein [Bacteroidales bacterium]|nr:diacylglycerol kinase family protein [Bacteroidales bacterium]
MQKDGKISSKKLRHSFHYAFSGFADLLREESNARIHCIISVLVIAAGFIFRISAAEWIGVAFAIGLVLSAEAFNTALERLADVIQPDQDERIRDVKDLAAAAVLLCALAAAAVGLIVFVPKIIALF